MLFKKNVIRIPTKIPTRVMILSHVWSITNPNQIKRNRLKYLMLS